MKEKPLSIKIIALLYLLAPIGNVIQIAYFNHWPLKGPRSVFNHLSVYEYCILALFPIVAFGIWRVSRWGYVLCLSFAGFLVLHNTYWYFINRAYSPYVVLLFQLVIFAIVGVFLQKHIMAPYFNPKIRWWESDPRYKVNLTAEIRQDQKIQNCQILDVSVSGCFAQSKKEYNLGETLAITVNLDQSLHFSCEAKVVWVKKQDENGYGLMFTHVQKAEAQKIKNLIRELQKSSTGRPSGSPKENFQSA